MFEVVLNSDGNGGGKFKSDRRLRLIGEMYKEARREGPRVNSMALS